MGIPYLSMSDDELFPLTNLALPAWLLLALLPRWSYTFPITTTVSLFFSALYIALMLDVLVFHPVNAGIDDFTSLDGLLKLFSFKSAIFGGWVHYIAFDLWTGMWITNDANLSGFPQLLLIPCLFFTLMLGPAGLLGYLALKSICGYTLKSKTS